MKLCFKGSDKVIGGIGELSEELGFVITDEKDASIIIDVLCNQGKSLVVELNSNRGTINYGHDISRFFRGLGLLVEAVNDGKGSFHHREEPCFTNNGAMLDVSRNAVMKPEIIKYMIRRMALMGHNTLMLYTEDTFEISTRPYFGHMRGRYTKEEIKEIDGYALLFGIELIPCVQFLGHLATALRWHATASYRDTPDILLVGAEQTYAFIDDMLRTLSECFSGDRIHMGMDEAYALGLGKYLEQHGYRDQKEIFFEHLEKIVEMAKGYGFKPMMWSDMFFRISADKGKGYRDYDVHTDLGENIGDMVPDGVDQVFWDYYHDNKDFYTINMDKHKLLGKNTIFAGGIWTWVGWSAVYDLTLANTLPALNACKEKGIKDVFATIWHNGAESSLILSLAGLQIYAEFGYSGEYDEKWVAKRFKTCCSAEYGDFMELSRVEGPRSRLTGDTIVRYLLYNDPLLGLFDRHVQALELDGFYGDLSRNFTGLGPEDGLIKPAFDVIRALLSVLELKADFGVRLKDAYDAGDRDALFQLAKECSEIGERFDTLKLTHRDAWMLYNKPFGWEVLEARYSALASRFSTTKDRITEFLEGNLSLIEELEEERLWYDCRGDDAPSGTKFKSGWGNFPQIYTAGRL